MRVTIPAACAAVLLWGAGARALDCGKAGAPLEKAICADPAAQAADEEMGEAYEALAARLDPAHRHPLILSQRRFIDLRGRLCAGETYAGDAACALKMTRERAAFLSGRPQSGPGAAGGFAPLFIQHEGKDGEYGIGVDALKFVDPQAKGEAAFNAEIDRLLKRTPKPDDADVPKDRTYSYLASVASTYASNRFVSGKAFVYDYSGGAHGNSGTKAFAFDLPSGRKLKFGDMFAAQAKAQLAQDCYDQIAAQRRAKGNDDSSNPYYMPRDVRKAVESGVGDLSAWSFFADRATVHFDPYEVGPYADGDYECAFPLAALKPLLAYDYTAP